MKKYLNFIIVLFPLLFLCSCDRWDIPPSEDVFFKIRKDGSDLQDSILRQCTIFYFNQSGNLIQRPPENIHDSSFVYLALDYYQSSEFLNSAIGFFRYIQVYSINENIHDFYIKYPNGDIDTLFIKAEKVSNKKGKKERCYCVSPLRELRFNGKEVQEDFSIKLNNGQAVYLFEK